MNNSPAPSKDQDPKPETTFPIAFGENPKGVKLTIRDLTFEGFSEFCSEAQQGPKHDAWFLRGGDVEKVESHKTSSGREYGPGYYRGNRYLKSAEFLIIDGDSSTDNDKSAPPPRLVHEALKELNIKHFIYTTHSHSKKINKFRAVIPCRMLPNELEATAIKIIQDLNDLEIKIKFVNEMKVWAQIWFLPTRDNPDDGVFEFYKFLKGKDYPAVEDLDDETVSKNKQSSNSTKSGLSFGDHVAEMYKSGELHIHYAPMCQSRANEGKSAQKIYDEIRPICVSAASMHDREWGDGRDLNLMEASESAVNKFNAEKASTPKYFDPLAMLDSLYALTEDDVKDIGDDEWVYKDLLIEGHILTLIGESGAGKTALLVHLSPEFVGAGYGV